MEQQRPPADASASASLTLTTEPTLNWQRSASAENASLAWIALEESRDSDTLIESTFALSLSPMFRLLQVEYLDRMAQLLAQPGDTAEQQDFELRLLCGRVYLAGVRSARIKVVR